MISRALIGFLIFSCLTSPLVSQSVLRGQVVNSHGEQVPFARMGIVNTHITSLSDEQGYFNLEIPGQYSNDSLTIQAPGLLTTSFPLDSLLKLTEVTLVLPDALTDLGQIEVNRKKTRTKSRTLGNKAKVKGGSASYPGEWTVTLLIDVKEEFAQVKKVKFHLAESKSDSVFLRPVVFSYDSLSHMPGKELLTANLISKHAVSKGWTELDLSKLQFYITGKVFIGIEVLSMSGGVSGDLAFSIGFLGTLAKDKIWEKSNLLDSWRNASNSYLIKVLVEY